MPMENANTGTWEVIEFATTGNNKQGHYQINGTGDFQFDEILSTPDNCDRDLANATFASACPEMLKALEEFMKQAEVKFSVAGGYGHFSEAVRLGTIAINKATIPNLAIE